jgi:hypothetical protein
VSKLASKKVVFRGALESEKAQQEGTFEAYAYFFENFARSTKIPGLKEKYMQLLYGEVTRSNTIEAYNNFLERFPLAKDLAQNARHKRDSLYFVRYSGTVDSLNLYITLFPASRFLKEALGMRDMMAYEKAKEEATVAGLEDFIHRYPAALEVTEARATRDSLVLEQVKAMSSELEFNKLLSDYPYLINQPRTKSVLEDVLFREAKRLDDAEYYKEFLDRCPNSTHAEEIREKLNAKQ